MNYILLLISVTAVTMKASVVNNFGKRRMNGMRDMYMFNAMFSFAAIIFILIVGGIIKQCSGYTVMTGIIYGLMTMAAEICSLKAMQYGPMSFAVFLSSCGMLLPIAYGVIILREDISSVELISLAVLFAAIFLVINPKTSGEKAEKWSIYGLGAMVMVGMVGILQKVHQRSAYKAELILFMAAAFSAYFIASLVMAVRCKKDGAGAVFNKSLIGIAVLSGICCGANNIINLYLSGIMPAIVFFPIANGGYILLATLSARFVFKEKITSAQTIGIILGIFALCGLGIYG